MKGQLTFNADRRYERGRSFRSQRRRVLVAVTWQTETNFFWSVKAQNQAQSAHHIRLLSVKHLDLSMSIFCSSSLHLLRSFSSSCLSESTFDSSLSFLSSSSETDKCDHLDMFDADSGPEVMEAQLATETWWAESVNVDGIFLDWLNRPREKQRWNSVGFSRWKKVGHSLQSKAAYSRKKCFSNKAISRWPLISIRSERSSWGVADDDPWLVCQEAQERSKLSR